jgi:hypothetical protein
MPVNVRRAHAPVRKALSCDEERVNWNSGDRRAGPRWSRSLSCL